MKLQSKPSVSIVLPVYNEEKYLRQCLDSLINQTFKNIEIICVDDGSIDSSIKIINEYIKKDSRVKLIRQKNHHAGVARNNGLKVATGKYILFLDSDDFFELNMIERLYETAERNNSEVVLFAYYIYDEKIKCDCNRISVNCKKNKIVSSKDLGDRIFDVTCAAAWNKFVLLSFIKENNLFFQDLKTSNDRYFTTILLLNSKRLFAINDAFIHYRINNSNSLQSKHDQKNNIEHIKNTLSSTIAIKEKLVEDGLFSGETKKGFYKHNSDIANSLCTNILDKDIYEQIYYLLKNNLIPYVFDDKNDINKKTVAYDLYNISFSDFCLKYYKDKTFNYNNNNLISKIKRKISKI